MPCASTKAILITACIAIAAYAQAHVDAPLPLTKAEALELIDLEPAAIAARLEARVNVGLPGESDFEEAAAAFEAYAVEALERVRREHGSVDTDFTFDIDRLLWGTPEGAIDAGWTLEEYERTLAERRAAVVATAAALTTPESMRLIDRMAASAQPRISMNADDPLAWAMPPGRLDRFANGNVSLSSLLSRAARDAARAGDRDAAVRRLHRMWAVMGSLYERPRSMLHGVRHRSWTDSLAQDGVRPVLATGVLDAKACRELREMLELVDVLAVGRAAADADVFTSAGIMLLYLPEDDAAAVKAIKADWGMFVEHWSNLRPAYERPIGEGGHWAHAVAFAAELDAKGETHASISAPTMMRAAFGAQVEQLQIDASIIMLALEEHRLDTGAHPESLADLVPDYLDVVRLDPLTGESFRYVRTDDGGAAPMTGYTLYSIGADFHDDGGAVDPDDHHAGLRPAPADNEAYDYIFNRASPLHAPANNGPE